MFRVTLHDFIIFYKNICQKIIFPVTMLDITLIYSSYDLRNFN